MREDAYIIVDVRTKEEYDEIMDLNFEIPAKKSFYMKTSAFIYGIQDSRKHLQPFQISQTR